MYRTTLRQIITDPNVENVIATPTGVRRIIARTVSEFGEGVISLTPDAVENGGGNVFGSGQKYDTGPCVIDHGPVYIASPQKGTIIEVEVHHTIPGDAQSGEEIVYKTFIPTVGQSPGTDAANGGSVDWESLGSWSNPLSSVQVVLNESDNDSYYIVAMSWVPRNNPIPTAAEIAEVILNLDVRAQAEGGELPIVIDSIRPIRGGTIQAFDYVTNNGNGPFWPVNFQQVLEFKPVDDPLWGEAWIADDFNNSESSPNNPSVSVTTIQAGEAPTNEKQRVVHTAAGGTFTLTFSGATTAAIAFNASAAAVQSALEGLSNIAPGDVVVTLNATSDWLVEFTGAYAGVDVPIMTGNGTNLTLAGGGSIQTTTVTQGGTSNTKFRLWAWGGPPSAGFDTPHDTLPGAYGVRFWYNASADPHSYTTYEEVYLGLGYGAAHFQALLEALPNIAPGDVVVTEGVEEYSPDYPEHAYYDVEFIGSKAGIDWRMGQGATNSAPLVCSTSRGVSIEFLNLNGTPVVIRPSVDVASASTLYAREVFFGIGTNPAHNSPCGSGYDPLHNRGVISFGGPVNEVQLITILNSPLGGTFTLSFQGQTTAAIAYNASAAAVQTALENLSNIAPGDVVVTKSGWSYTVTFGGVWAATDVAQITASPSLTGAAVSINTTVESSAGTDEVQRVTLSGGGVGGVWGLTWDAGGGDETTADIAINATAGAVQSALEALATPGPGDFVVTGNAGGPYLVTFGGVYDNTDVNEMEGKAGLAAASFGFAIAVKVPSTPLTGSMRVSIFYAEVKVGYYPV